MELITALQDTINKYPETFRYWVSYSGGCDSHVLLHALHRLSHTKSKHINIGAIHVNHGLQDQADAWSTHCESICEELDIQFKVLNIDATAKNGQSPEAAARATRYQAFIDFLPKDDVLLLAHHQDDQAETLLLQLMRGSGPRGLSAMPTMKLHGKHRLIRPFLNSTRKDIETYANKYQLNWVEDPSNKNTRYDRNRIRHEVIPVMQQRWPSISKTLSRAALYQSEAAECLFELAELDWKQIQDKDNSNLNISCQTGLPIETLQQLSFVRQKNLIRYWIEQFNDCDGIDSAHLNRIFNEVLPAAIDSQPKVEWQNTRVCRYRNVLYVYSIDKSSLLDVAMSWQIDQEINLQTHRLVSKRIVGHGLKESLIHNGRLDIRYRQGGERCKPRGRGNHHSLKKLFQEWAVPPWMRSQIPLIYIGNELAQIVGYCVCDPFAASATEQGILVESERL